MGWDFAGCSGDEDKILKRNLDVNRKIFKTIENCIIRVLFSAIEYWEMMERKEENRFVPKSCSRKNDDPTNLLDPETPTNHLEWIVANGLFPKPEKLTGLHPGDRNEMKRGF